LEEGCFDLGFYGCTIGPGMQLLSAGFACERLVLWGCRLTGSHDTVVGVTAPGSIVTDLTIDGTVGGGAAFFDGPRMRISNVVADCPVALRNGGAMLGVNIVAPAVLLGGPGGAATDYGVAIDCPNAQIQKGSWRKLP
jgi:hypothetical protein